MQPNIIFGAYMPTPTPAHAVQLLVPLPVNANNEMGTDYQVTAPPISDGPSSGTSGTIAYSALNGLGDREEITITAVGGTNFGSLGPELFFASDLRNSVAGQNFDVTDYDGYGVVSHINVGEELKVAAVPELPNGKGFVIGTDGTGQNGTDYHGILVESSPVKETPRFFEHYVMFWPQANQDNAQVALDLNCTWQIKGGWDRFSHFNRDYEFKSHPSDGAYFKNTTDESGYFKQSGIVSSGFDGTSWNFGLDPGASKATDPKSKNMKTSPVVQQTAFDIDETEGSVTVYFRDVGTGDTDFAYSGLMQTMVPSDEIQTPHIGPTLFTLPGFVRGFQTELGQEMYYGDYVKQYGEGAFARVIVTEFQDPMANGGARIAIFKIDNWAESGNEITATIRKGLFLDNSLTGNWLHVYDYTNTLIGSVQI